MKMKPEDLRMIHDLEQAETRIVDLIRQHPQLAQQAGNSLLHELGTRWQMTNSPLYEFMYHAAWIGCHRVCTLDDERAQLDFDALEGDSHDDDDDAEPVGA